MSERFAPTILLLGLGLLCVMAGGPVGAATVDRFVWWNPAPVGSATGEFPLAQQLRQAGITGVVFPALSEGRPSYPSRLLPSEVVDVGLGEQLAAFRAEGLKVAAYIQVFIHGGDLEQEYHPARKLSEWVSYRMEGNTLQPGSPASPQEMGGVDGVFLDPGIPRCREYLMGLIAEAAMHFQPDWILLDHLRYPLPEPVSAGSAGWIQPYGYHPGSRSRFTEEAGFDPAMTDSQNGEGAEDAPTDAAERAGLWNDWRRTQVTSFLEGVGGFLKTNLPDCQIAAVGYPDPFVARELGLQDWPEWLRRNLIQAAVLPSNGRGETTRERVALLPDALRDRVWISGALPETPSSPANLEEDIAKLSAGNGLILFDAVRLLSRDAETYTPLWNPVPSVSIEDYPVAAPVPLTESRDSEDLAPPFESPVTEEMPPLEDIPEEAPAPESTLETGEETSAFLPRFGEEIRALYDFRPTEAPFAGLSPNQVAEKLKALGFNAVFGGSSDGALRRALEVGGILRFEEIPLFVGEGNWERHPESKPIASNGRPLKKQSWYAPVCPSQPWLRAEKMERILSHVASRNLDGVWLDFIRYPVFWEEVPPFLPETCFCPVCLNAFREKTGIEAIGGEVADEAKWILENYSEEWHRWRADNILEFVETVRNEVKKISPDTLIGAFVLPWTEAEYEGALYRIAGQDLQGFGERLDVLSPMLYFHQLGKSPSWVSDRVAGVASQVACPVLPIIQGYDLPTPLREEDLRTAMDAARAQPSQGVILFSQPHLEKGGKWDVVGEELSFTAP